MQGIGVMQWFLVHKPRRGLGVEAVCWALPTLALFVP